MGGGDADHWSDDDDDPQDLWLFEEEEELFYAVFYRLPGSVVGKLLERLALSS